MYQLNLHLCVGNHLRSMPVRGISAGAQSSMALSIGGHVFCWGCNGRGRLGLGPAYDQELTNRSTRHGILIRHRISIRPTETLYVSKGTAMY